MDPKLIYLLKNKNVETHTCIINCLVTREADKFCDVS